MRPGDWRLVPDLLLGELTGRSLGTAENAHRCNWSQENCKLKTTRNLKSFQVEPFSEFFVIGKRRQEKGKRWV
jgi:hypothetical protein